jgi:hypothetical protein
MGFVPDKPSAGAFVPDAPQPPSGPMDILKDVGSKFARPVAKGAINTLFFIPDLAVEAVNAIPQSVIGGGKDELPSSYWGRQLDKVTRPPKDTTGKVLEEVEGMMVGGGMGSAVNKMTGAAKDATTAAMQRGVKGLEPSVTKPLNRITTKAAEEAHAAGYNLPPKYIGGAVRKQLQTIGGSAKVDQEFSKENMEVTDRLAKLSLGLHPSEELNPQNLLRLKDDAYKEYEAVRALGKIPADPAFDAAVKAAGGRFAEVGKSYGGGSRYASIAEEKLRYLGTSEVDAGETLDEIRALRKASQANLKNYNPEANALGMTQREIAKAMEDRIESAATKMGNTSLVANLREARTKLAKIFNVEDSIGAGGHVDAHDLKRLADSGVPLTDGLKTIAETATHFGDAVKNVAAKGESGAWSAIDYMLGGSGFVSGHARIAGLAFARPILRKMISNEGAQKSMISNLGKPPSALSKAAAGAMKAAGPAARATGKGAAVRIPEIAAEDENAQTQ